LTGKWNRKFLLRILIPKHLFWEFPNPKTSNKVGFMTIKNTYLNALSNFILQAGWIPSQIHL